MTGAVPGSRTRNTWASDVVLGVRLAVGSGRTVKSSLVRLGLVTIGIGLSTAVMLLLAAVVTGLSHSNDRLDARAPVQAAAGQGAPLLEAERFMTYGGTPGINVIYLEPLTPSAPVPPGLRVIPAPGEMVVSPALAKSLNSDGHLRARFDQQVVGTIGSDGLQGPDELWAYAGATGLKDHGEAISGFGGAASLHMEGPVIFLGVLGVLVVLIPLLVFVASSSRIAGAERERRLSALRLAGASSRQVHRIAAAETLVGAAAGELLGFVAFALVRPFAAHVGIAGITVFSDDFMPSWPLVLLVLVIVPLIATGSAWLGMRKLVVEPLGVVRMGKTARRRAWWRLLLVVAGVVFLVPDKVFGVDGGPSQKTPFLVVGAALLLIGLPTLMPWLTERVVSQLRGGFPAWQLAVRRLQLDSGTPSRVVAGLVVVVAGVISLHMLLDSADASNAAQISRAADAQTMRVNIEGGDEAAALTRLRAQPGVQGGDIEYRGVLKGDHSYGLLVAPCSALQRAYQVSDCVDGDAFVADGIKPGQTFSVAADYGSKSTGSRFTVPANATTPAKMSRENWEDVALTPAAAASMNLSALQAWVALRLSSDPGAAEQVYAAMAPWQWRADVGSSEIAGSAGGDSYMAEFKALLSTGALLALSLAGVSLLVMTIGQISERRRPLAAMSAGGVPRGVLERSLLWQNAIPMFFGVLVAVGGGIGVGLLTERMIGGPKATLDWSFIVTLALAAVVLVLAVTAATLPSLRSVTRVETLRAE
ncbi:FtsX-like permease family protein [Amycolatopsis pigmentata]|uniref:FtsX-like permease family protein n=1 Tax=Amycolatopsis pigmentata TaxID=450801 RepID=A0ABW5FXW1_9PSEU